MHVMINLDSKEYRNLIGVIIPHENGNTYTRQTGGFYIDIPKAAGTFISFIQSRPDAGDAKIDQVREQLFKMFFLFSKYGGRSSGIDEDTATEIDDILKYFLETQQPDFTEICGADIKNIYVDRKKVSQEAWVFVTVLLADNTERAGILTWENSD
jgi:hypothetical protein